MDFNLGVLTSCYAYRDRKFVGVFCEFLVPNHDEVKNNSIRTG
jgi:hypothetical protein